VMQLNFGGADGRAGKMARFQLGPVYCRYSFNEFVYTNFGFILFSSGFASDNKANIRWKEGPQDCRDLWRSGVTQVNIGFGHDKNDI
jgi:hypothetical protein